MNDREKAFRLKEKEYKLKEKADKIRCKAIDKKMKILLRQIIKGDREIIVKFPSVGAVTGTVLTIDINNNYWKPIEVSFSEGLYHTIKVTEYAPFIGEHEVDKSVPYTRDWIALDYISFKPKNK